MFWEGNDELTSETSWNDHVCLHEEEEGPERYTGNADHHDGREDQS